jgi:DNA-binding NtrC family response regulator
MTMAGFEPLHDLLDAAGFSVRLFASPGGFLRTAAVYEVDCVVSDLATPAIDGFALPMAGPASAPDPSGPRTAEQAGCGATQPQ